MVHLVLNLRSVRFLHETLLFSPSGEELPCSSLVSFSGCLHRSWNVCTKGKKGSCDTGRFRDGSCKGNEEGYR